MPGIFGGDEADELEDLQGPKRDVLEIADWRSDDIEKPFRVSGHQRILSYHCEIGLSPDSLIGRHARGRTTTPLRRRFPFVSLRGAPHRRHHGWGPRPRRPDRGLPPLGD